MGLAEHAVVVQTVRVVFVVAIRQQIKQAERMIGPGPKLDAQIPGLGKLGNCVARSGRSAERLGRDPERSALDHQRLLAVSTQRDGGDGAAETRADDDGVVGFLRRCLSRGECP